MSKEKFKALTHYIINQCVDNPAKLGAVRLNKALWYADMFAYQSNGVSISGERYLKRPKGPVPATILATLRELKDDGYILIREPEHRYDPRKYISLQSANSDLLSEDDKGLVAEVLKFVCDQTANEISDLTHDDIWDAALEGEEIPLYATLASGKGEITKDIKAWAQEKITEIDSIAAHEAA